MEKNVADIYVAAFKEMVDQKAVEIEKISPFLRRKFEERSRYLVNKSAEELPSHTSVDSARAQISVYYDMLSPYWDIGAGSRGV